MPDRQPVAVITGASQGLGLALARELAGRGWSLVLDARGAERLDRAAATLPGGPHRVVAGDVTEPAHRRDVVDAAAALGGADALVNNASTLGASPLPALADLGTATYLRVLEVNLVAPVVLAAALAGQLRRRSGRVLNVTSDAGVEAYPTWGGYGSSKAGLDHASRVLAAEEPSLRVYAVDPGDMRTRMHQDAFPGEDISDRPDPEHAVPGLLRLLTEDLPSGRYRAADVQSGWAAPGVSA
ncbi:MAG: short-chain dehydrogenase/reductase [Nocardioides sp.]|nr:short-chain dehydrogenase/reductase [Nocardioides sp.]